MQLLLLSVISLSFVFSCMAAPSNGERYTRFSLVSSKLLVKRQSSTTPSQCTSTCDPVESVISQSDPSPSTFCTQSFETEYYNCLVCVGTADNATTADYADAQQELDNYYLACLNDGYSLPEVTLPGQNPNRTLTTSFPSTAPQSTLASTSPASAVPQTTLTTPPSQSTVAPPLSQSTFLTPSASGSSSSPAATTNAGSKMLSPNGMWAGLVTLGWIMAMMQ